MQIWKQSPSFKQQALQFWTAVGNLPGVAQSPTGGHAIAPELVQVPAAVVRGRRESETERAVRIRCIVESG
jgi:hypothetical protein